MRVLYNTYPVAFDCPGGGEIQLLRSRQAAEEQGVEVALYDLWHPQLDRVDVVHYFSVQGGSTNFCNYVKQRRLPLVISPILWLTAENRPLLPLGEIAALLHACDRILPNSQAEADQLAAEFALDPQKFTIVPNGVDPAFARVVDPALFRKRFELKGPLVLNVANIEPRKNQERLCRVAQRLGVQLALVGRVRDQAYLDRCLAAGEGAARYLGYLDHEDDLLKSAYRACDVFALPSLLETPGLAALEAAIHGAKVVITNEGSTREYFGTHAEYVDPLDEQSLHTALARQLAAPREGKLSAHILANFTWSHAGAALRQAYQQALPTLAQAG